MVGKCKIKNCNREATREGLCGRHYQQQQKHGKIFDRTKYDNNEIQIKDNYAEITVYDEKQDKKEKVLIDIDKVSKIKECKIYTNSRGYAVVNYKQDKLYLTEFLFGETDELYIFKNKNPLDCRKKNLLLSDRSELGKRVKIPVSNKTGIKGVHKYKRTGKYEAYITNKGTKYHLGAYDTLEEAKQARLEGEKRYWGKIYSKDQD